MVETRKIIRAALFVALAALGLAGCSTAPVQKGDEVIEPLFTADRILSEGVAYASEVHDPWEGFNRTIYRFNYRFDKYLFLPTVRAYKAVVPDIAEQGIHNFFNNIGDIRTLFNSILQLSPEKSLNSASRVAWNSTVGLFGLIDVAGGLMAIPRANEDFGQTLGYWGVGSGPYLVLPILGPSSARDGVGVGVDFFTIGRIRDATTDLHTLQEWTWWALNAIDLRANIPFRYFETGSPFEYDMVRWLFTTKRQVEIDI